MKRLRILLALALLATLAACSSSGPLYQPVALQSAAPAELKVERLWKRAESLDELNKVYDRLQMLAVGNVLFNVNAGGDLIALDAASGETQWQRKLGIVISAGVGGNGEMLLLGGSEGKLLALAPADGTQRWQASLQTEIVGVPVLSATYVIAQCVDGSVYALNASSGKILWQTSLPAPALTLRGYSAAVVVDDKVLLGGADGKLRAMSLHDGQTLWEAVVATPKGRTDLERLVDVDSTPIVQGGVVYSSAYQGRVVAVSLDSGRLLWARDIGVSATMLLNDGRLYVIDDASHVWGLDARSGATLWKQEQLAHRKLNGLVLHNQALLLGDYEGYVHWLALEDGRLLARRQIDDRSVVAPPVVRDGVAYIRSRASKVYALTTHSSAAL